MTDMDMFADLQTGSATATATEEKPKAESKNESAQEHLNVANGDIPDGYKTVPDFVAHISTQAALRAIEAGTDMAEAIEANYVTPATVYQAIKGVRNPLPSAVLHWQVTADGVTKDEKQVVIPVEAGTAAWFERGAGGTGTSGVPRTEEQKSNLLYKAGKLVADRIPKIQKRLDAAQEQLDKANSLKGRYVGWLGEEDLTMDDAVAEFNARKGEKEAAEEGTPSEA